MTASDVLGALMVGGLMGLVGQGARAAIGLKKMNDLASDSDNNLGWNDVFVASRLIISLVIGFLAGVVAAIAIGIDAISTAFTSDMLIKLAAAGYAGTDAIEAFTASLASPGGKTTAQAPAAKPISDASAVQLTTKMSLLNANISTLSGSLAALAPPAPAAAPPPGSKDASAAELAQDMQEARKYFTGISQAATKYGLAPSLICAIGSRESNWGQGSDMRPKGPSGTGDWAPRNPQKWGYAMPPDGLGWGRGLMQVDYAESGFGKTGDWMDPTANILFGANELATNIKHYTANPTSGVDPVRAAVAAYNCGQGNVANAIKDGFDVDHYTTGGDYSTDVMGRAAWFKSNGFDNQPLVS
jgi:soluble lytic murein transglycosylase-like protein